MYVIQHIAVTGTQHHTTIQSIQQHITNILPYILRSIQCTELLQQCSMDSNKIQLNQCFYETNDVACRMIY